VGPGRQASSRAGRPDRQGSRLPRPLFSRRAPHEPATPRGLAGECETRQAGDRPPQGVGRKRLRSPKGGPERSGGVRRIASSVGACRSRRWDAACARSLIRLVATSIGLEPSHIIPDTAPRSRLDPRPPVEAIRRLGPMRYSVPPCRVQPLDARRPNRDSSVLTSLGTGDPGGPLAAIGYSVS